MFTIIAVTRDGREYSYSCTRAYRVTAKNADVFCNALNNSGYKLENIHEKWNVYTVSKYEILTSNAQFEMLTRRGNKISIIKKGVY